MRLGTNPSGTPPVQPNWLKPADGKRGPTVRLAPPDGLRMSVGAAAAPRRPLDEAALKRLRRQALAEARALVDPVSVMS